MKYRLDIKGLNQLTVFWNFRFKDSAYFCYCACILRISPWSEKVGFLISGVKTEIFLRRKAEKGKADLSKGYWNPKRKLGVATHFLEKIKFQMEKIPYIVLYFGTFICLLILFSFWIPIALAEICFSCES